MKVRFFEKHLTSFQIILAGFIALILAGSFLLVLPLSSKAGVWTSAQDAVFTAASAVCVTGLVVRDTAEYWSLFGQTVILVLIQIGGLGIITVTALIINASGKKVTLLQRSMLQESISAHQLGGVFGLTKLIFKVAFVSESIGALFMLPAFLNAFGRQGIWMSIFHSVSAFCNAGFDLMGDKTGEFSSLTYFSGNALVIIPVCLLIMTGGIGFLTWDDILRHRLQLKKYSMQSKLILSMTALLVLIPTLLFFICEFSDPDLKRRFLVSLLAAVSPRTAGFSSFDLGELSSEGQTMTVILMFIGASPGSTAGGVKTTTLAVLLANTAAVVRMRKSPSIFRRRIDDDTVKSASTLMMLYLFLAFGAAFVISSAEGLPFGACIFETVSAIGTVGLSLGLTPSLGYLSRGVLVCLMIFGRVGGLTLLYAALNTQKTDNAQYPVGRINVG